MGSNNHNNQQKNQNCNGIKGDALKAAGKPSVVVKAEVAAGDSVSIEGSGSLKGLSANASVSPGAAGEGAMLFYGVSVPIYGKPSPVSSTITLGAGFRFAGELQFGWGGENGFYVNFSFGQGIGEIISFNPIDVTINTHLGSISSGVPCVGKP